MLAEWRGLEYVFEIIKALHGSSSRLDSKSIYNKIVVNNKIETNLSYMQKILPRMVKIGILTSSDSGYALARSINEIMISDVLEFCLMPDVDSPLKDVCFKIKEALTLTSVDEFYDFNK